jgi:hypothetical protein
MQVLYDSSWTDRPALQSGDKPLVLAVERKDGRACVHIDLSSAGLMILV